MKVHEATAVFDSYFTDVPSRDFHPTGKLVACTKGAAAAPLELLECALRHPERPRNMFLTKVAKRLRKRRKCGRQDGLSHIGSLSALQALAFAGGHQPCSRQCGSR